MWCVDFVEVDGFYVVEDYVGVVGFFEVGGELVVD